MLEHVSKTGQPLEVSAQWLLEVELHRMGIKTLAGYPLPLEPEHAAELLARAIKPVSFEVKTLSAQSPLHDAADAHVDRLAAKFDRAFTRAKKAGLTRGFKAREGVILATLKTALGDLSNDLVRVIADGGQVGLDRLRVREETQQRNLAGGMFRMFFDKKNPSVIEWAKEHAAELITNILDSTREKIRSASEDLQDDGDWDSYYDRILNAVGDENRADLIARHETMLAADEGQRLGWEQAQKAGLLSGQERREWITTDDERVCPICKELSGKLATMNGTYPGGFDGPPAHVQCRCTEGIVG
jgi:hypothetical protein